MPAPRLPWRTACLALSLVGCRSGGDSGLAPPAAPSELACRLDETGAAELSWRDNAGDEREYVVRRQTGAGEWRELARLPADAVLHRDVDLAAGTRYTYTVAARNEHGEGESEPIVFETASGGRGCALGFYDPSWQNGPPGGGTGGLDGSAVPSAWLVDVVAGRTTAAAEVASATVPTLLDGGTGTPGLALRAERAFELGRNVLRLHAALLRLGPEDDGGRGDACVFVHDPARGDPAVALRSAVAHGAPVVRVVPWLLDAVPLRPDDEHLLELRQDPATRRWEVQVDGWAAASDLPPDAIVAVPVRYVDR